MENNNSEQVSTVNNSTNNKKEKTIVKPGVVKAANILARVYFGIDILGIAICFVMFILGAVAAAQGKAEAKDVAIADLVMGIIGVGVFIASLVLAWKSWKRLELQKSDMHSLAIANCIFNTALGVLMIINNNQLKAAGR